MKQVPVWTTFSTGTLLFRQVAFTVFTILIAINYTFPFLHAPTIYYADSWCQYTRGAVLYPPGNHVQLFLFFFLSFFFSFFYF